MVRRQDEAAQGRGAARAPDRHAGVLRRLDRSPRLHVAGARLSADAAEVVAARVRSERRPGVPYLVGLAGAVAVGKSTFAASLRRALAPLDAEVVSTDGFLRSNADLAADGLLLQKGFPASYDGDAIATFLSTLGAGGEAAMGVYSHETYDRVPGEVRRVGGADVVILEGVNALQPNIARHLDLGIYLDADEPLVRSWFVDRFLALVDAAGDDATSFYRRFVDLSEAERREVAISVWEGVNLVNLTEHIAATRASADLVLTKAEGHRFS